MVEKIVIRLGPRKLEFYQNELLISTYPVAIGKPETPSPVGNWQIINKHINPGGVLGSRWMGFDAPNGPYGIHGTNNPASIGKMASKGCIRMHNANVEELFPQVSLGTPVIIVVA